jgi:hypothetical protein
MANVVFRQGSDGEISAIFVDLVDCATPFVSEGVSHPKVAMSVASYCASSPNNPGNPPV